MANQFGFSCCRVFADVPEYLQWGFQDPASPTMEGIIDLHHDLFFFLIVILVFVMWMLFRSVYLFNSMGRPEKLFHGATLELVWTLCPSVILLLIALPSFGLLYALEGGPAPQVTIKAIGHQWYWSYEYRGMLGGEDYRGGFDSYMIPDTELTPGELRLLEVDNRCVVPRGTQLRFVITSGDVLHSWAVPTLGLKCDAVPGRLNQTACFIKREGLFYGQCSELCGANHGFMPIVVEAASPVDFARWVAGMQQ
jgi:cytochrome c oxidase subunit 2